MMRDRIALVTVVIVSSSCLTSRGERVGYQITGAFQGPSTQTYTLFGITVPRNSPVTGTFSYDTTTPGVDAGAGVRNYHQLIEGGYTLDINNGAIQLAGGDYTVTVANDYGSPASDIFSVVFNYDSANGVTPVPIQVNGAAWSGTRAFINMSLSWDASTFHGPDEPKLNSDRPQTLNSSVTAFVGSSARHDSFP
jgi:hypothetical protein